MHIIVRSFWGLDQNLTTILLWEEKTFSNNANLDSVQLSGSSLASDSGEDNANDIYKLHPNFMFFSV